MPTDKSKNLLDEHDWLMFVCYLREARPLFSALMAMCSPVLLWDGTLRLIFSQEARFARERADENAEELGELVKRHFGERVKLVEIMQVVA